MAPFLLHWKKNYQNNLPSPIWWIIVKGLHEYVNGDRCPWRFDNRIRGNRTHPGLWCHGRCWHSEIQRHGGKHQGRGFLYPRTTSSNFAYHGLYTSVRPGYPMGSKIKLQSKYLSLFKYFPDCVHILVI